jgi:hypothetical protein
LRILKIVELEFLICPKYSYCKIPVEVDELTTTLAYQDKLLRLDAHERKE